MAIRITPMTKSELKRYVDSYKTYFCNWTQVRSEGFLRFSGPIAQQVWFENLRSGAYRPASAISILVARNSVMLHRFLDVRNRQVLPREHEGKFKEICKAMEEQFVPPISLPLNPIEVLKTCEENARESIQDAHALSAFHAYFGNLDSARKWMDAIKRMTNGRDNLQDWEISCLQDVKQLEQAIQQGNVREFLEEIRCAEESRLMGP
jgi:hypothetical protein